MKLLFSSPDSAEIGLLNGRLESAGICCEIRNEFLSPAMPGAPFYPEIWVLKDEDLAEAHELLTAWSQAIPPEKGGFGHMRFTVFNRWF
jgi:hypothetical protein